MRKRAGRDFFKQPTIKVSKQLLGKFLVRQIDKKKLVGRIVETEAYIGPDDKASHAAFGKTKRCAPMYGVPGTAYVYFIYGMYWMLNIVTEEEGKPCAVLIRAVEPCNREEREEFRKSTDLRKLGSGPGKLCQWMEIDGSFNGEDLVASRRLWIEDRGIKIKLDEIVSAKRIGVEYAGPWKDKFWRFYIKNNPFVSKK